MPRPKPQEANMRRREVITSASGPLLTPLADIGVHMGYEGLARNLNECSQMRLRSFAFALILLGAASTMTVADDVKRISTNGTELAYIEVGQGEPGHIRSRRPPGLSDVGRASSEVCGTIQGNRL